MLYYRIEATMSETRDTDDYHKRQQYAAEMRVKTDSFYQKNKRQIFLFLSHIRENSITVGCIAQVNTDLEDILPSFWQALGLEVIVDNVEETTLNVTQDLLHTAYRNSFVRNDDDIMEEFKIDNLDRGGINFNECIYEVTTSKRQLILKAKELLCEGSLCPEIERIYAGAKSKVFGHPVHYLAISDDVVVREDMVKILHSALYANGRIESCRCCTITFFNDDRFSKQCLDNLYASCSGGMIYLKLLLDEEEISDVRKSNIDFISVICEIMRKHKNDVLTVFGICRTGKKVKEDLFRNLGNTTIVELDEEVIFGEKAKNYLKLLAKRAGVPGDKKLYRCVNDCERGYLGSDLNKEFDYWFNNKLKTDVYPQYRDIAAVSTQVIAEKPKGSAYSRLQKMTGLDGAKKVIGQALNYYKAQKLFRQKGMKADHPAMHMVFTGNPGTAKTSVARLFAAIMKENGLLSRGDLFEVGRADVVGQYVGSTAPLVKKLFNEAKGSVLFIDEAYSLVDDRNGLYGDEAINTIVQEMENNREDIVVIFAGYPDKMKEFLNRNPGLNSRIAFHVPFEDYTAEQLVEISSFIAEEKGLTLECGAKQKLLSVYSDAVNAPDFGNGRFARNIIEKARMAQAERLLKKDFECVTPDDIATLTAEDIQVDNKPRQGRISIGF